MLALPCPVCGPRAEAEFTYGGEAGLERPDPAQSATDVAWSNYLFVRKNPKGVTRERWRHAYGCGVWLEIERSTTTHEITSMPLEADA